MDWQRIVPVMVGLIAYACSQLTKESILAVSLKARKLPYEVCGQSDISGVRLGAYPWMVAIGYVMDINPEEYVWKMAGNLITDQFVLSVASGMPPHYNVGYVMSKVRLGAVDLDYRPNYIPSPVDIEVEKAIPHPDYDKSKMINDIGLIKLKTKVEFGNLIKPICLPPPEFHEISFLGKHGVIIGYGKGEAGRPRLSLAETSVEIKHLESCRQNLSLVVPNVVMDERVFCASSPGRDACHGDTGGPLMMYRRYRGKSKMFIMGLISYGYKCAVEGFPGVYTNVTSFMYWIVDNLDL